MRSSYVASTIERAVENELVFRRVNEEIAASAAAALADRPAPAR
jgi:hypothetical protein